MPRGAINWASRTREQQRQEYLGNLGLLTLRVGIAILMLFLHGSDKLVRFGDLVDGFPDPLGLGSTVSLVLVVFAEFFCSLAIAFGFRTRLAAVPLILTMLVAVLFVHSDDPWSNRELALVYLVPYICLLMTGPGAFSVDRLVFGKGDEPQARVF